jgi:ABC-type polar amino acid transport system ATPase subunit
MDPSQNTKKEPSLLKDKPFGNWRFLARTVVSLVVGSYFRTLPLSSAEKTNCMKFLHEITVLKQMNNGSLLLKKENLSDHYEKQQKTTRSSHSMIRAVEICQGPP